jgi:hypothetical protein
MNGVYKLAHSFNPNIHLLAQFELLGNKIRNNIYRKITPWSKILLEKVRVTVSLFMKFESSLLCSQGPTTGPYSEPDESSPQLQFMYQYNKMNVNEIEHER